MTTFILAIDQGTTSTRAIIFNERGEHQAEHQIPFQQYFPHNGWVEHDPEEIWQTTLHCIQQVLEKATLSAKQISALGISNQRETTLLWNRKTGKPIAPAIVWQDRRTADLCHQLLEDKSLSNTIHEKTGLLIDPYFSATKIAWLLDQVPHAREEAEQGKLAFGTIDTFLLWRLTGGRQHATDASNASRTMLFNIKTQSWDQDLLELFKIPPAILPTVLDNNAYFGETDPKLFDGVIPITGIAGDQQAAAIAQACFSPGMVKSTYGTGCFILLNTGKEAVHSKNRLLSTIAYRLNGDVTYGLEGSIFMAGATMQWLRDAMHLIQKPSEAQALAESINDTNGVYLVPAFTGLGAPYWDPDARGALLGLTRNSSVQHIVRAALEAVCYQTRDLMEAMQSDTQISFHSLRVDGGMAANEWLLQFLADILDTTIERPTFSESSALGAAYLAGLGAGIYSSLAEIQELWTLKKEFIPQMPNDQRSRLYSGWQSSVKKILENGSM